MNWTNLWLKLFGTTQLLGLNIGFWAAMVMVCVIVVLMNVAFWSMKPKVRKTGESNEEIDGTTF